MRCTHRYLRAKRKLIIVLISIFTIYKYLFSISSTRAGKISTLLHEPKKAILLGRTVLESECSCRKNEKIIVSKYANRSDIEVLSTKNNISYWVDENELNHINCNLFNTLRRGKKQKVISYSLYGKKKYYYDLLLYTSDVIKKQYPGWTVRVYHDSTINDDSKCDLECLEDEKGFMDNVDFCNIEYLPRFNFHNWLPNEKTVNTTYDHQRPETRKFVKNWNAEHIHGMIWRFFPMGDYFVDLFSSRDSDSRILQREIDSVAVWLNSEKAGHIMRDHPQHGTFILGGMWGFFNSRMRGLADTLFQKMISPELALKYNKNKNEKGQDQYFLSDHVYKEIKDHSLIHDSFHCKNYKDSQPFPSQRVGHCFVGIPSNLIQYNSCDHQVFHECPIECRPSQHQDWLTC